MKPRYKTNIFKDLLQNPSRFHMKLQRFPIFFRKLIFKFHSKKKIGFLAKDSSRGYTGRTFKDSVELKIGISIHCEAFSGLGNLLCGFHFFSNDVTQSGTGTGYGTCHLR